MSDNTTGRLLVFEGIDGVGKSTQVQRLVERLRASDREVVQSREPTDGPYGKELRRSMAEGRLSPDRELQLFLHDRRDHVDNLLRPAVERGALVVLDRYYFSTVAYQGARGFDQQELLAMNEAFAPEPDLLLVLDMDTQSGLKRVRNRDESPDTFEVPELLERSRAIFAALVAQKSYGHLIDASGTPDEVAARVWSVLEQSGLIAS